MALIEKITAIADAIRAKTGSTGLMNLDEMAEMITLMDTGSGEATTLDNTYILVDENGYEIPAVLTEEEVKLTATAASDIRIGTTAVTDEGVVTGEKEIPAYYVSEGTRVITKGSSFIVPADSKLYDYTKFQAIVCTYNTNLSDSVAAIKVVIADNVYETGSTISVSNIIKNETACNIDLGIMNDTDGICILRYFMYKEMY